MATILVCVKFSDLSLWLIESVVYYMHMQDIEYTGKIKKKYIHYIEVLDTVSTETQVAFKS